MDPLSKTMPIPMKECIQLCWECRTTCQTVLYNHCLVEGGAHVERTHITLMSDCIEVCQTAADLMVRRSPGHAAVCNACADICLACATSCDGVAADTGSREMVACADICRRCAESCRAMSRVRQAA